MAASLTIVTTSDPIGGKLPSLLSALSRLATSSAEHFEVIIVDDLKYWRAESDIRKPDLPGLRVSVIWYPERVGQLTAVMRGLEKVSTEEVLTIDPDMHACVVEIPEMRKRLGEDADIVHGIRRERLDIGLLRRIGSCVANIAVRSITGIEVRDIGSPVALLRTDVIKHLPREKGNPRLNTYIRLGSRVTTYTLVHGTEKDAPSQYSLGKLFITLVKLIHSAVIGRRYNNKHKTGQ